MQNRGLRAPIFVFAFLLLLPSFTLAQREPTKIKVVTELANIREQPAIDSPIIKQIQQDEILEALDKQGEWYRVVFIKDSGEGTTGYIHESLVTVVEGAPERIYRPLIKPIEEDRPQPKKPTPKKEKPPQPEIQKPRPKPAEGGASVEDFLHRLGARFALGTNYVKGGQLNEGAKGLADYYEEILAAKKTYKIKPVHFAYLTSIDIFLPLQDKFFFGFGIDYFRGELESAVKFDRTDPAYYYSARPKVEAVPFRIYIAYHPLSFIYTKIGIEYYFASASYYYRLQTEGSWQEWSGRARAQGLGFLGGVGYEYELAPFAKLFAEAVARYAKIKGFKGTDNYRESTEYTHSETGILYFYKGQIREDKAVPLLYIRERTPTEAGVVDPKEATIDFSGVAVRAGIQFSFNLFSRRL